MRKLLLIFTLLLSTTLAHAQSYNWIKGGGSITDYTSLSLSNSEKVTHMCTDHNGNVYVVAYMGVNNILADTFYRAFANIVTAGAKHVFMASYTCDGALRWGKMLECRGTTVPGGIEYYNGSIYFAGFLGSGMSPKYIGMDTIVSSPNLQGFTMRIDTGGQFKWIKFIGPDVFATQSKVRVQSALAVDGSGCIHNFRFIEAGLPITGSFTTSSPAHTI